jgi:import inner membrane translocase subunit TIM17
MEQTPCPDRFLDDCGGAFAMGCIGGGAWFGVRGMRDAPRGWGNRFGGFVDGVRGRAPQYGGQFAVWGGLFAASDCTITHLRGKEDWKNSVMAGAATSGLLAIRGAYLSRRFEHCLHLWSECKANRTDIGPVAQVLSSHRIASAAH